jgi:WhiB family redox-sensing transcriptional regulator
VAEPIAREKPDWMARGSCLGMDPNVFHPIHVERSGRELSAAYKLAVEKARLVCKNCPVRIQCRDHAMTYREKEGIWGGLSSEERRKLWRRQQAGSRGGRGY